MSAVRTGVRAYMDATPLMKEISFLSMEVVRRLHVRRQSGIHVSTKRQETKNILQTIRIHLSVKPFLGKQIKKALFQLVNTCTLLYYLLEARQNVFFPR